MEKIIPFKKDIEFENISEIKSISLEHTLEIKDNLISGSFIISGTYKMTEVSINLDDFNYNLPFKISIDSKYDTSNVKLDINDFYYEVIDSKILSVNIEVKIENLIEKEVEELVREDETFDALEEELEEIKEENIEEIKEENIEDTETNEKEESQRQIITSIFDTEGNDNYVTYKVHVVSENDTIETILQKYEISLSKLEDYNNISDIKIGDKIIIPSQWN